MVRQHDRKAKIVILVALLMPVLAGVGAFAVDVGYISYSRNRLQAGADAAALAVADEMSDSNANMQGIAAQYAEANRPTRGQLQLTAEAGKWDEETASFAVSSLSEANAARVTVTAENCSLFFGPLLGRSYVNPTASAVATRPRGGVGTRFLIDD